MPRRAPTDGFTASHSKGSRHLALTTKQYHQFKKTKKRATPLSIALFQLRIAFTATEHSALPRLPHDQYARAR